ncbi:MAG: Calx-beta domain-containing protein [Acidimicrobiales bacterium]
MVIPLLLGAVGLLLSEQPVTAAPPVDIPAIARANEKSQDRVREILADPTAKVDARNRLYYEDPVPPAAAAAEVAEAAPFPYSQTFLLHSRPSSSRKIYLDFNGHTISGTAWNGTYGSPAGAYLAEAFSLDATTDFSTAEQDIIQSVWQRVSEDYAVFDVDVTTQDPGIDAITRSGTADLAYGTRALITDATEIANNCTCGGIAYLGVFDEPNSHAFYQPAFVFAPALSDNAKNIAEAVTHEVGHNFDLSHDGTASSSYYSGHGSWAPIMGSGYNRPITQWSKGEYTGANNLQNDLAVIPANGGALLADDYGNTTATATSLGSGPSVSRSGVITTDADIDVFRVDAAAGAATFTARPALVSPNLDILLELRNSAGTLLASNNPLSATVSADVASGLSATISTTLPAAGAYYLWVSGVGAGAAATTGYSGYASIGRYTFTGTIPTGARTVSINDRAVSEGGPGVFPKATFNVTLSSAAPAAVTVVASTANGTAIAGSDYTALSTTLSFPAGTTTLPFSVTVTGDATVEPNETFVVNLTSPSSGLALGDAQGVGTITNDDASGPVNNNFAAATAVAGATGTINGSNVGATKETGEPAHAGNAGGKSVWYRWTAPATGTVSFDTVGSNFDTLLAVYTGTAVNALTAVASNDDTGGGLQSKVTFNVTSGVVYRIAVDGYNGLNGTVKLNWL